MHFFLMSQGSFNPKIRFLGQKVCPVARVQTDGPKSTEGILSGFQDFFIHPIIRDWPNRGHISGVNHSTYNQVAVQCRSPYEQNQDYTHLN